MNITLILLCAIIQFLKIELIILIGTECFLTVNPSLYYMLGMAW